MADGRSSYRVRIAGQEILFPDLETVQRLVGEGQIGASAEVRAPGSDRWVPLAELLAGKPARRDPWAVWEDAEHVDPADIWKEFSGPRGAASGPSAPRPPAEEPVELPPAALTPVEEERPRPEPVGASAPSGPRMVIDAARRPSGKVIAFPARATAPRPETAGANALAPVVEPVEPVPLRPPPRPPRPVPVLEPAPSPAAPAVRWVRVGALLLVGVLLLLLLRWYVVGQANERFQPVAGPAPVLPAPAAPPEPAPPPVPAEAPAAAPAADEPYAELERQLRGLMLSDVRDASGEEAIEDALHVELDAVRVNVLRVDATVVGWAGRKRDQPKVLELRVDLQSDAGRLDTDLGAVGLVVGKYVQRYGFEMPRFEVVFEGIGEAPLKLALDPEASRLLYIGRKTMLDYLSTRPG